MQEKDIIWIMAYMLASLGAWNGALDILRNVDFDFESRMKEPGDCKELAESIRLEMPKELRDALGKINLL